jgi:HD-like signal output (HDOD) protein
MRSLVQLFSTDPVLTARLLAAANGPAHLLGQRVHSIPEALVLLAPVQLRQLMQKAAPVSASHVSAGWSLANFWRYSLDTARMARALAMSVQANASQAYALGLLHGLGELLLQAADLTLSSGFPSCWSPCIPSAPRSKCS